MAVTKILDLPIGVFDSGFGGISVLGKCLQLLPQENYLYFADSKHAPYGVRPTVEIKQLAASAVDFLLAKGIKALLVACNTATSVVINDLRSQLQVPVIGMEPALKPAIELPGQGAVVVMATPVTLAENKFRNLMSRFEGAKEIIPLPCPGLVELIEQGYFQGEVIREYLSQLFASINWHQVDYLVLGCTHYIFVRNEIKQLLGEGVQLIDGNLGTVHQLKKSLVTAGLLKPPVAVPPAESSPQVKFYTSGEASVILPVCQRMLDFARQL